MHRRQRTAIMRTRFCYTTSTSPMFLTLLLACCTTWCTTPLHAEIWPPQKRSASARHGRVAMDEWPAGIWCSDSETSIIFKELQVIKRRRCYFVFIAQYVQHPACPRWTPRNDKWEKAIAQAWDYPSPAATQQQTRGKQFWRRELPDYITARVLCLVKPSSKLRICTDLSLLLTGQRD